MRLEAHRGYAMKSRESPLVLFGAFDRHNLGDLLLAHVAASRAGGRPLVFAGLAERDLTAWGGHRVEAVTRLAAEWWDRFGDCAVDVCHVGGEILTCDAYEAAVMLMSPSEAAAAIAAHDDDPQRIAWAQRRLGIFHRAAYVLPKTLFRRAGRFIYEAVGGFDLSRRDRTFREEVFTRLRQADFLSVRDAMTAGVLRRAGIETAYVADPVEEVSRLFGERIGRHARQGEVASLHERFAEGYAAVQFAASIADDKTLDRLATVLSRLAKMPLVFFRAGAAPWHDELEPYRRLSARLALPCVVFESLNIWDICALIAGARQVWSTSLHAALVARACGVPCAELPLEPSHPALGKLRTYLHTWNGLP